MRCFCQFRHPFCDNIQFCNIACSDCEASVVFKYATSEDHIFGNIDRTDCERHSPVSIYQNVRRPTGPENQNKVQQNCLSQFPVPNLTTVDESGFQACNCRRIWLPSLQLSTNLASKPATVDESGSQACNCRRIWPPALLFGLV